MKTAEMKIEVSGGRVIEAKVMPNGSCVLTVKLDTATTNDDACHMRERIFKKVPASQLSLKDEFMNYKPKTEQEKRFMEEVKNVIKADVRDFWRPVCDPSFDDNDRICYEPGKKVAVGKSYNWWYTNAKEFWPERGSRIGTRSEYIAFLAVLIKELIDSGKSIVWAWNAVCNNSNKLGHYWDYWCMDDQRDFEPTGSREICGWCDLGNASKLLVADKDPAGFLIAGGGYYTSSFNDPLATLSRNYNRDRANNFSCGWLVLTEDSTAH